MGGCDIHSHLTSVYTTARTHLRVWWLLFLFLLDSAVVNSFLICRSYTESSHRTFQRDIALRLLRVPLSYDRQRAFNVTTANQKPTQILKTHHEYIKMDRSYCKGRKGCGASSQRRGKNNVLKDADINTLGRKPGRTVWGCKQCGLNCCKKRECWLALPRHEDTAISGANKAFPLV